MGQHRLQRHRACGNCRETFLMDAEQFKFHVSECEDGSAGYVPMPEHSVTDRVDGASAPELSQSVTTTPAAPQCPTPQTA